ncbi:Histidine kinase-, DNA gyrase B-, and HSP90-like ATPase [Flavobacterium fluvii]|uniref:Histidine kinase-, DNA gyrase B-, and HSP90-like ATPase n=1 Tax=Flavobacterium fluvii TaxID=468056 RepID=A0A1M5P7U9_9FLAO|nr:Histidine kinase-, DNA gyrase B-, and HSP90-like ATPase [Flavobacterium fluvii]
MLFLFFLFQGFTCFSQSGAIAENSMQKGVLAYSKGDYKEALELFQKCAILYKKSKNIELLGKTYNNLGNTFSRIGKSEQALTNYLSAIAFSKQSRDSLNIAKTYKNIGTVYEEQKDFKSAMYYYDLAYDFAKKVNNDLLMADCENNMGIVYEQQYNYVKALKMYSNAFEIYKAKKDEEKIAMVLNNLAIVYKYLKDYPKAVKNYEAAILLSNKLGDKFMVAANQNNLGNVYELMGNHSKSLEFCLLANANARAIQAQEVIIESYDGISTAYEKLHQYPKAIKYRKLFEEEKSSFINTQRTTQLSEMQVKFETQKKVDEILVLQQERKIRNLKIKEQNFQLTRKNNQMIVFFLFVFGLVVIALIWKSRQKLKYQLIQEKIIRETEEQERLRIAKDIHDDLGSGLSKINFLSEIIFQKTEHLPDIRNSSESVKETAKKMIENMRDLIWSLNSDNNTIANLVARMREYTTDYLEDFSIDLKYSFPDELPQTNITKEAHHELFMVVKETLNNIAKHSKATAVFFAIEISSQNLVLSIKDNGIGLDEKNKKGNGLRNMKSRLEAIGGTFDLVSEKDLGTEIRVGVPLQKIVK